MNKKILSIFPWIVILLMFLLVFVSIMCGGCELKKKETKLMVQDTTLKYLDSLTRFDKLDAVVRRLLWIYWNRHPEDRKMLLDYVRCFSNDTLFRNSISVGDTFSWSSW